jgi:hypothetical protein
MGGSGYIGIRNANCAMLFLIILAALGYCVILDANHFSKLQIGVQEGARSNGILVYEATLKL